MPANYPIKRITIWIMQRRLSIKHRLIFETLNNERTIENSVEEMGDSEKYAGQAYRRYHDKWNEIFAPHVRIAERRKCIEVDRRIRSTPTD